MNKLGHYIFKRICKDQALMKNKRPMNMYVLFVNTKDIQNYINDYMNYGIDYTGSDNISAEDTIERYWDEPEGKEH